MKRNVFIILLGLMVNLLLADADVNEIIENVEEKYNEVDAIQVDFKQISRFKITNLENETFGRLWLAHDNKFRLETEDQTLVSNGKTYWRYNKLEEQVLIDHAKDTQQDIFMNNFLFNLSESYHTQLISENKNNGQMLYEVKLTPKNPDDSFFQNIKVWIIDDNWKINRVVYVDYNDNETEYVIDEILLNPDISNDKFKFDVQEKSDVVDLRF